MNLGSQHVFQKECGIIFGRNCTQKDPNNAKKREVSRFSFLGSFIETIFELIPCTKLD